MTAAQMRKMMEGVVLYGTGKPAQLNGYSSGGKTGTAQKIDPVTQLYSKTMHIASFAGIAPVNNPVIAVAVVMDDPKGGRTTARPSPRRCLPRWRSRCSSTSACRTTSMCCPRPRPPKQPPVAEDDAAQTAGDIKALYAAANDCPPTIPCAEAGIKLGGGGDQALRGGEIKPASSKAAAPAAPAAKRRPSSLRRSIASGSASGLAEAPDRPPRRRLQPPDVVIVDERQKLRVPSFIGLRVRGVIERADAAGLQVEITGSGTVREQAPVPGTMVAPGTRI